MTKKINKKTTILTTIICLIPVILGVIFYPKLPDQIVTHWDAQGVPNGWQSKFVGAIVFPGILVLVNLATPFLMKTDPKYENMDGKIRSMIQWIIPAVALLASGITLASGLGVDVPITLIMPMFLGLIFVIIGNYLPKTKQSYTVGIKLPWTLHSEENWNKTHRMAGFLWVICGILMILSSFFTWRGIAVTVVTVIAVIVPMVYSYLIYQKSMK